MEKKKAEKKPEKKKKSEVSGSAVAGPSSERSNVFTALCRDPKYRKANAEFLTRRLRLEFDKLTTARPLCKASAAPREFLLPSELHKCHQSNFRTNAKKLKKRSIFYIKIIRSPFETMQNCLAISFFPYLIHSLCATFLME